jgi:hypothetical protein
VENDYNCLVSSVGSQRNWYVALYKVSSHPMLTGVPRQAQEMNTTHTTLTKPK